MRRFWTVLLMISWASAASVSRAEGTGSEAPTSCPDPAALARELIEMELAGVRVGGRAKASCLDQGRFPHVRVLQPDFGEVESTARILEPDEATPFVLGEMRPGKQGTVVFDFVWKVRQGQRSRDVPDQIAIALYRGPSRRYFGCASTLIAPVHFVLRRSCRR